MRSQSTAVFDTLSRLQCLFLVKQGRVKPGITFYQPRGASACLTLSVLRTTNVEQEDFARAIGIT